MQCRYRCSDGRDDHRPEQAEWLGAPDRPVHHATGRSTAPCPQQLLWAGRHQEWRSRSHCILPVRGDAHTRGRPALPGHRTHGGHGDDQFVRAPTKSDRGRHPRVELAAGDVASARWSLCESVVVGNDTSAICALVSSTSG